MNATEIRVGLGSCGVASGGEPVHAALLAEARQAGAERVVKTVGCNGLCHREPLVEVISTDGRSTLAPVLMVDEHTAGKLTPASAHAALDAVAQKEPS